ncbi:MAG: hypothetical protein HUN04_21660 [Desulfobacter sp.]|nr:MAG: hypothetical protein HUN04_21660 [Desulfobacter sp.]
MKGLNLGRYAGIGIILFCTMMVSVAFAGGEPVSKEDRIQHQRMGKQQAGHFTGKADVVYEKDGWRLNVFITQKGSRSQGSHGILLKNGKPVNGKKGETLETAIGTLRYQGPFGMRANLWDSTGWVMVHALVKPEWTYQIKPGPARPNLEGLEKALQESSRNKE